MDKNYTDPKKCWPPKMDKDLDLIFRIGDTMSDFLGRHGVAGQLDGPYQAWAHPNYHRETPETIRGDSSIGDGGLNDKVLRSATAFVAYSLSMTSAPTVEVSV